MFLRSAMFACASVLMISAAAPAMAEISAAPPPAAPCADMSFRIYFSHGSSELNALAMETLARAERAAAACDYSELRVTVDATSPQAAERAEAIRAATTGRSWDAVHVAPQVMAHHASYDDGPEYAAIVMSPVATTPNNAPIVSTDSGV
jgi:hypothetical protein